MTKTFMTLKCGHHEFDGHTDKSLNNTPKEA